MTPIEVVRDSDAQRTPKRVALIRRETPARVLVDPEELGTTAPNLLLREIILAQICVIVLALISLAFDAPLEGIADPSNTPNPAKAPWYFLGLQELLHYFPPVVAGVLIPGLVVVAIVVIPYFGVNSDTAGFLASGRRKKLAGAASVTAIVSALMAAFKVWAVLVPSVLVFMVMAFAALPQCPPKWRARLTRVPISNWVMIWFVAVTTMLTLIGVMFRGPGWKWVWPWHLGLHG